MNFDDLICALLFASSAYFRRGMPTQNWRWTASRQIPYGRASF